jgi:hypothetical protein
MKSIPVAVLLLVFAVPAGILPLQTASAADVKPDVVYQWEYRVLSEEQVIALAKKDLAAGLNKLGDEGWELVTAGGNYIFKRPKNAAQKQAAEIKRQIAVAEADVAAWKERLAWSERMLRKGYMTETQVESERTRLKRAEIVLGEMRDALKNLPSVPDESQPKKPGGDK